MPTALFKKMTFGLSPHAVVLHAPDSFSSELEAMRAETDVFENIPEHEPVSFALVFVQTLEGIETAVASLQNRLVEDPQLWFAYPKGTSKKYTCELNRDAGWQALGKAGFEPVRQVAIDEDWSALRFRHVHFIKQMKRSQTMALSNTGKERTRKS